MTWYLVFLRTEQGKYVCVCVRERDRNRDSKRGHCRDWIQDIEYAKQVLYLWAITPAWKLESLFLKLLEGLNEEVCVSYPSTGFGMQYPS